MGGAAPNRAPEGTAPAALPGQNAPASPEPPVRARGPRGWRLTSWRTPWTTTRGRGCRGTILAAGLGGDSPGAGLAHRRSGRRTGGRTERRDTPPAVPAHGALPGSGQTPALPRRSARRRSAPRAAMAGGRRAEAGGRRRRCPAPPAGTPGPPHSPRPGPAALRAGGTRPPGPQRRERCRGGGASPPGAERTPLPRAGRPGPHGKFKEAAAPPPPAAAPPSRAALWEPFPCCGEAETGGEILDGHSPVLAL